MSYKALRQPKKKPQPKVSLQKNEILKPKQIDLPKLENVAKKHVILTLNNNNKLVVTSDAYNGIIVAGNKFKCVFCGVEIGGGVVGKESHLSSEKHRNAMEKCPHLDCYSENLLRMISSTLYYCTICNVTVMKMFLNRHLSAEMHAEELDKATKKAGYYKPVA